MPGERLLRILDRLSSPDAGDDGTARLCEVAADVTQMSGAGLMLMSGDVSRGSLCSSNKVSAALEDLQFTFGEGPCIDAFRLDRPVLEPDLADPETTRWVAFSPAALRGGRARRVRLSRTGRHRASGLAQSLSRSLRSTHGRAARRLARHGRRGGPGGDRNAVRGPAGVNRNRVRVGGRTAFRCPPSVGNGVGATRRDCRRSADSHARVRIWQRPPARRCRKRRGGTEKEIRNGRNVKDISVARTAAVVPVANEPYDQQDSELSPNRGDDSAGGG